MAGSPTPLHRKFRAALHWRFWSRLAGYALIWLILTGTDGKSWIIGGPAVLLAGTCGLLLNGSPARPLKPRGLLFFGLFFLRQSFLGGIDVLRRTLSPRQLLNPGLVPYTTFLPEGSPRVLFANTISLLPGTLSVDLEDNTIIIHTIDINLPTWVNIQNLEGHIAALFQASPTKEKT